MIKKFPSIRHIAFAEAKHLSKFEMQYPDICFYVGDDGLKQLAALQDYDLFRKCSCRISWLDTDIDGNRA